MTRRVLLQEKAHRGDTQVIVNKTTRLAAIALLLGSTSLAQAATIAITPHHSSAQPGDIVTFELYGNFDDEPTLGGGFDIVFRADQLSVVSFTYADIGDPAFQFTPVASPGALTGISFGELFGCPGPDCAPDGGNFLIGTLDLLVDPLASQGIAFINGPTNSDPAPGPFASGVTFGEQAVDFKGATLAIKVVPIPAAVWLMFGALAALAGLGRTRG